MKKISIMLVMLLSAMSLFSQRIPNISVFADHIYESAKQDDISFREASQQVYDAGVRGVDVYVNMDPRDLMTLDSIGFSHASAILVTDLVNGECRDDLDKALAFMHRYNFKRLLLVPGLMSGNPTDEQLDVLYRRIDAFTRQAKEQGLDVTVEDYDNAKSPCYNTACLNRMFKACPSLNLTFDTGNFCICNEDVMEACRHFLSKIKHVHLKDRKAMGVWDVVAVGTGVVPTRQFVSTLMQKGYDGWFTIECYGAERMTDALKIGAKNLRSITIQEGTASDSLAIVGARWEKTSHIKGITEWHSAFSKLYGGQQDIYIVEVNLKQHPIEVLDHQGRALTSEKAMVRKASAAINGTYFDMGKTDRSICLLVKKGKVVDYTKSPIGQLSNGAVVSCGSKVEIKPWDVTKEYTLYPDSQAVVSLAGKDVMVCGPLLLQNGKEEKFYGQGHILKKNPRSGIAVRGNKAYLVVIDGRDDNRAIGVTIPEFAHFMRMMKMDSALNLDGGGSSVLWVYPQVDKYNDGTPVCPCIGILNCPSDGHGKERTVSNSIIAQ